MPHPVYYTKYTIRQGLCALIIRNKEDHHITINASFQQEDNTFVNIYAPNIGASKYIKQKLTNLEEDTDSNAIIAGDFNTLLS